MKVFDIQLKKEVFALVNPLWCDTGNLKCLLPGNLTVCKQVKTRAERMKEAEPDWVPFDYVYFSQTGK